MRSWLLATALFLVMIGVLACGTAGRGFSSSYVEPGPHFDHAGHMKRGIECSDCHGGEKEEWRAMPELAACKECHDDIDGEKPPEKRAASYFAADGKTPAWTAGRKLDAEVIFPHGAHVLAHGKQCNACHEEVINSTGQPTSTWRSMDECMGCHQTAAPTKNECATCHSEIRIDRAPKSHAMGWKRAHGRVAIEGGLDPLPKDCAICHKRADCDMCHRAEAPANHTNFWRLRGHATMASLDRDRCRVCHTTDSCWNCHQNMKPRNHTPTWGGSFNRHCNSCHLPVSGTDQGCFVCHKGSPGHASAPMRPGNVWHMTNDPNQCRVCHTPATLGHPDNGQSCLLCHH